MFHIAPLPGGVGGSLRQRYRSAHGRPARHMHEIVQVRSRLRELALRQRAALVHAVEMYQPFAIHCVEVTVVPRQDGARFVTVVGTKCAREKVSRTLCLTLYVKAIGWEG